MGGRSLTAGVIAGSLLLTNLSTEQVVGLNGSAYKSGLSVMVWETLAAIAMIVTAIYLLPKYLKSGLTTVPGFLEKRFDVTTKTLTSILFLTGYVVVLLPVILYSGSLAISGMFDVPHLLGVTHTLKKENIEKVQNPEIRNAMETLQGSTFNSQKELFNNLQPLLGESNLHEFKRNEVKNFISINATLVLIAILLYVAAFAISLGPVMWTLLSEIFPGNIKGIAISVVGFFNSLVSYTVTQFFPWELTNLGPTLTFAIYAVMAILSLLFVMKFVIETKGKSLEELEELLIED